MQNPIIRILMLFVGAYTVLSVLAKVSPLDKIVVLLAGLFAAIIWLARYNRTLLYSLSLKPGIGPVIHAACKLAQEQPPVDPSLDSPNQNGEAKKSPDEAETTRLLLHSDGDFSSATRQLKEAIRGHNDSLEALADQIRRNVQLRDGGSTQISMPPLGVFVLVGNKGLGKRSLATEIGYRIYKGSSVSLLDVSDPGAHAGLLVSEARSNPFTSFVLENFQGCSKEFQEGLLSIVAGAPQVDSKTGSKVSFRHCFFFLLVHRDAEGMERPSRNRAGGTGHTLVVDSLNASMEIDKRLGWSLHGIYPFVLPPPMQQAEVVAQIIQQECKKYNLTLGRVDPAILAHEVQVISAHKSFEITPPRITKIMNDRLLAALAAKEQLVDLDAQGSRSDQRRYSG